MKKNNNWILPVAFIIFIIFWKFISDEQPAPNPKIEIYNSSIESIIDFSSEIEVLADSISLPEGPVWDSNSKSLLFVDVMGNKLYNGMKRMVLPNIYHQVETQGMLLMLILDY